MRHNPTFPIRGVGHGRQEVAATGVNVKRWVGLLRNRVHTNEAGFTQRSRERHERALSLSHTHNNTHTHTNTHQTHLFLQDGLDAVLPLLNTSGEVGLVPVLL
jgi:hypothetical protein